VSEWYATIVVKPKRSLELVDAVKDFSGLRVVDQASFQVSPGAVAGLIGPNGGDKTALGRWTRVELSGSVGRAVTPSLVQPQEIVTNIRVIDNTFGTAGMDHFPT